MSTRANIIVKEDNEKLYFYRHSDGYPDGTLPSLNKLMEWLKVGIIRDNISQFSGWLILIGAMEYNSIPVYGKPTNPYGGVDIKTIENPKDWKVGAFEPTTGLHDDIEYLYLIDLNTKEVSIVNKAEWRQYE